MAEFVVVVTLPGTAEHFTRSGDKLLSIGRAVESDICLAHPLVSRQHAEVERLDDGRFAVRDLGSRNGTLVGSTMLHAGEVAMESEVVFQVGPYLITASRGGPEEDTITVEPPLSPRRASLDRGIRTLNVDGQPVIPKVAGLEYRLLSALDAGAPNLVHNGPLGDAIWGEGQWDTYMLHNLVRRVRRKLEERELDADAILVTVPGVGYRFA
jgi:predicted component of type VI protein secretion system